MHFILAIMLTLPAFGYRAQSTQTTGEQTDIMTTVQNYMDGYYTANAARMERALHPEFQKRTLRMMNGHLQIKKDSVSSMLAGVRSGSGKRIPTNERVQKVEIYDVYKNGASAKVITGRWTDYMIFTKADGQWRVLDVLLQYTKK